jgi:hypothetical protein
VQVVTVADFRRHADCLRTFYRGDDDYFTGIENAQIDRLFRFSGNVREKWRSSLCKHLLKRAERFRSNSFFAIRYVPSR